MIKYTIPQKQSGTGSIYDIASEHCDREIKFIRGANFAVVLPVYYGGKGYTTHQTWGATIKQSNYLTASRIYHEIIDPNGNMYGIDGDILGLV